MKYRFEELTLDDLDELYEWLNRPHVAHWWEGQITKEDFKKYQNHLKDPSIRLYFVLHENKKIGFLELYNAVAQQKDGWWLDQKEGTWGLDTFIADEKMLSKGHGSAYIKQFIKDYSKKLGVKKWIIDPDPKNIAAVKAYTKAGFKKSGIIDTPDGKSMLMEIIVK